MSNIVEDESVVKGILKLYVLDFGVVHSLLHVDAKAVVIMLR
ncbi:hypothetical protein [Shewanella glacialipiscicola]